MAVVHEVITLGIGTPADLLHLITFGLSGNPAVVLAAPTHRTIRVPLEARTLRLSAESRTFTVHG